MSVERRNAEQLRLIRMELERLRGKLYLNGREVKECAGRRDSFMRAPAKGERTVQVRYGAPSC